MQAMPFGADCRSFRVSAPEYVHSCSLVKTQLFSGYIPSVCKLELDKRTTVMFVGWLLEHLP